MNIKEVRLNILLIHHKGSLSKINPYTRSSYIEPLALPYLAAAVESHGHNVIVENDSIYKNKFINILNEFKPKVIGFSVYSYTFQISLDFARVAKNQKIYNNGSPIVVFGGYHPTACPEETISKKCVDFVVIGEGEETLCELLKFIENNNNDYNKVSGIAFKQKNNIVINSPRERIKDIDSLPFPKRERSKLIRCKQYQISYPPPSQQQSVAQVLYSRGCPFSCSYCSSALSWKKQIIWRSPEHVCDELEGLIKNYGTNLVYFPDLTFNASKVKVLDFCKTLIKRELKIHWWGFFRLDLLDKEILAALVDAKCVKLSLGIETPIQACAQKIKDKFEMNEKKQMEILQKANELGLFLRGFLMIGFPEDTEEKLLTYPKYMLNNNFDEIRVCFVTPFPGTLLFNEVIKSGHIPDNINWSSMTTEKPYLKNTKLSSQHLLKLQKQIIRDFYMSKQYIKHVVNKTSKHPKLKQSFIEFFQFLKKNKIFINHEKEFYMIKESLQF